MRCRSAILLLCLCIASRALAEPVELATDVPKNLPRIAKITRLTDPPKHHFVGYYGITPWNAEGTRLACLETDFGDRLVGADDVTSICLIDPATKALTRIATTSAWNLQQGSMLHWLPTAADREIIYNDRVDGRLVSVIFDIDAKRRRRRTLDRPIAAMSPDGEHAIGLNYDRLRQIRPVTGYAGGDANAKLVHRPADDGLFLIDVETGTSRLLISVEDALKTQQPPGRVDGQPFWLEHALFNRGLGDRVFFMARAFDPKSRQLVSLPLVMHLDGKPQALLPWAVQGASHYDWLDDQRLVLTREHTPGKWHHLLIDTVGVVPPKILAEHVLTRDGHCSFSPDGRWMITDTYPDERKMQHLFILDVHTGQAARLGSFFSPPTYRGDWRCDLHPRWDRESRRICIDSTHEGVRQVYVIDLDLPPP